MGLTNKPDSILQALDNYFLPESGSGLKILHRISTLFNETTESPIKIQQKFNLYFSYTSTARIRKYLDLLEYLSIFSSTKLPEIINTEVFVEAFANVIMEPEFQDDILNLLKIWFDRYDSSKGQVNKIFDFIENLQNFGMFLPTSYKSRYEGMDPAALMSVMDDKKELGYQQIPQPHGMDLENGESLMTKATKARTKAHALLSDPDFDNMPKPYMISTIRILVEELQEALVCVKTSNEPDVKGMENDLEHYCNELKKKIEYQPSKKVYTSTDEDYSMNDTEPDPEQGNNTTHKETVHGTVFTQMMELDQLLAYKTEPCKMEMRCRYAPTTKRGFQLGGALKKEMHCKDWHGMQDRRRPVYDTQGNMLYSASECRTKDECMSGENCRKTHNLFEFAFHPKNYKTKKCTGVCKNGKYCPYYHSKEENEAWANIKTVYLNLKDDEQEIVEDEDESGDEVRASNKALENVKRHMPANVLTDIRKNRVHYGPHEQPKTLSEKRGYETKIEIYDVPDGKPKDKELKSTLVIKKEYVDPKGMTNLLKNSPCFYNVPIFVGESTGINGVNGPEVVKKTVKQEQQNDDEI